MDNKDLNSVEAKDDFVMVERPINYAGLLPVFLLIIVAIARISYEVYKRNSKCFYNVFLNNNNINNITKTKLE